MAVYKSIPLDQAVNRQVSQLTADERTAAEATVTQFISLFTQAHS